MNNKILIGIAVLVIGAGALLLQQPAVNPPSPAETTTTPNDKITEEPVIEVTKSGFSPAVLTIKTGTKVTWVNKSETIANISSGPHPVHNAYPSLNLKNFNDSESISFTFDKTGTYGYHNHLNPSLTETTVDE